jgi:hypothetical protein
MAVCRDSSIRYYGCITKSTKNRFFRLWHISSDQNTLSLGLVKTIYKFPKLDELYDLGELGKIGDLDELGELDNLSKIGELGEIDELYELGKLDSLGKNKI